MKKEDLNYEELSKIVRDKLVHLLEHGGSINIRDYQHAAESLTKVRYGDWIK